MGKLDEVRAKYREARAAAAAASESVEEAYKEGKKAAKAASADGVSKGAMYAGLAAVGTLAVDRILFKLADRWPWIKTYRKWLDVAIGLALVGLSRLNKNWVGMAIAGAVWLAIQFFVFMANKMGMASGFSVEGMTITNDVGQQVRVEDEELELALFGSVLAGMSDEDADRVAEAVETGVIGTAVAVALPEVLAIAQQYGPQAVTTIQNIIKQARAGKKRKGAGRQIRDAREMKAASQAARAAKGALLPQTTPTPALPPGQDNGELLRALREGMQRELSAFKEQMEAQRDAWQLQQAQQVQQVQQAQQVQQTQAVEGLKERQERRENRREERRDDRQEQLEQRMTTAFQQAAAQQQS